MATEREHCEAVALADLRDKAVERRLGPVASRLFDCVSWADVVELVARERADARTKALEEAAQLVEDRLTVGLLSPPATKQVAKQIRALKETP